MHLHIIEEPRRRSGLGTEFVRLSVEEYFGALELRRLFCQPNAFNVAPNRTLQRVGFRYVFTEEMQPSVINFPQPITRWVLERLAETAGDVGSGGSLAGVTRAPRVVTGGTRIRHRCPHVVTESVGSPRFRACWSTVTTALRGLTLYRRVNARSAFPGPDLRPGNRPKARGSVTFPASSSPIRARCGFSRADPRRKSDLRPDLCPIFTNPSRPGRLIAVTASQDRDETPRTHLGLPRRPEQRPSRPP